ncbi:MAG: site-specific integrase [Acidobacteria bacterium]|nr:site-specific integrase [Acidobacteriota bacterium]
MARKLGQIVARGNQRWLVRVFLGRDLQTKKRVYHNRTIHGSMRKAQLYLNKALRERDLRRGVKGSKVLLGEYLDHWLEAGVRPRVRDGSYDDYAGQLRRYILPVLGDKLLDAISPLDIQNVYQQMIGRGLSGRTVRYVHAVLHSALNQAVSWQLLFQNPAVGLQLPREFQREMLVLTFDELRRFLRAAIPTSSGLILAIAATTGMRPNEYLAIKWTDIDWQKHTVAVTRTLHRRDGCWKFDGTKGRKGRRVIKLQNWVLELLQDLRHSRAQREMAADVWRDARELVFTTTSGNPINENTLRKHFKSLIAEAGVPRLRLYDLRHTAATLYISAGVSIKVVSEMLGHASTAFTLDTYAHVLPHMQDQAAAQVEWILLEKQGALSGNVIVSGHMGNSQTDPALERAGTLRDGEDNAPKSIIKNARS